MPAKTATPLPDRILLVLAGVLLSVCFICGGSSQETGLGVTIAQLLAIPVLLYALAQAWLGGHLAPARWSIAVVVLIVALPLLQLLPLPAWLWHMPAARVLLQQDLASAGVSTIDYRWSLAPAATQRDLLELLPGVALFFAALAMGRSAWRGALWWIIGLALFSVVLAFAQIAAAQDSILNPFPQFVPAMAGVFANKNHQASALAIGLVLSVAMLLDAKRQLSRGDAAQFQLGLCIALAAVFALVLPLVNSRAGVLIALVATAATLLNSGAMSFERLRQNRPTRWLIGLALVILAVGIYGSFAWMQSDADIDGSRWLMTATTWHLGWANAPLGSGFGSFVRMFEQATQGALMQTGYINNAHDDYVQWWFEGGVLAVAAMLAAAIVLIVALRRLLRRRLESSTRTLGLAALSGVLVLLLHSTVDYPLRTPALMAVFALLAGIAVGAASPSHKSEARTIKRHS